MNQSVKDFFIEYQVEHALPPEEEEWMVFYSDLIDQAERDHAYETSWE